MPKRKKIDENVPDVMDSTTEQPQGNQSGSGVDGLASGIQNSGGSQKATITIRLSETGEIDLAGMRESTASKLKAAIQATPEVIPGYGEIKLDGSSVPDFMVNAVYQLIGGVEQWAFARKYGPEIAQVMAYRPQDIAVLSEPTKAVLAKYLPKLGKYQEETALVMALASIHIGKVQAMNEMLARKEAQRATVTEIKPAPQNPIN